MTEEPVTYAEVAGVATITLNRPKARNAIDSPLARALHTCLDRAEASDAVRVVVLTGRRSRLLRRAGHQGVQQHGPRPPRRLRARPVRRHPRPAVGILPGGGMIVRLPRAVGRRLAMDMSFTGRVLSAEEALSHGLVSRVLPHEHLLPVVREMAETIAARDPFVVRELHALYRRSADVALPDALAHEPARRAAGAQLVPGSPGGGPVAPLARG